jgi:hypothetical protein
VSLWRKNPNVPTTAGSGSAADRASDAAGNAGEYRLLFTYLRDRFANRVVLTFAEIEDLLGFSLPGPARLQQDWWGTTGPIAPRSAQSDSWTLASRTATVNMAAQIVVFERHLADTRVKAASDAV